MMRRACLFATLLSLLTLSCGGDSGTGPNGDGDGNGDDNEDPIPTTAPVDANGGVVSTPDGAGAVAIPAGAVSNGVVTISVVELDRADFPDPTGRLSDVIALGPDGRNFDIPVEVSIALPAGLSGSQSTLWVLDESIMQWVELPLSYTADGRVYGQTMHFSAFSAAAAANPGECTNRGHVGLRDPGTVTVTPAQVKDQTHLIGSGTPFAQETGARWIVATRAFTVTGNAGPLAGQGKWIDFATGPNFETGTFSIGQGGGFSIGFDIPPLGFRYIGLTDACNAPFVTPENGWYYNLEVWCGEDCPEDGGGGGNVPGCNFPATVAMGARNDWVEATFTFLENQACEVGFNVVLGRAIVFRAYQSGARTATVIFGANRWEILSSTAGTSNNPANLWADLPAATDITMELRDAFDPQGATYALTFRFDGGGFTVLSFVEL